MKRLRNTSPNFRPQGDPGYVIQRNKMSRGDNTGSITDCSAHTRSDSTPGRPGPHFGTRGTRRFFRERRIIERLIRLHRCSIIAETDSTSSLGRTMVAGRWICSRLTGETVDR